MNFKQRTKNCGELRVDNIGEEVVLNGWVSVLRDLGGLIFIDLRDRSGIAQLVILPEDAEELAGKAKELKSEYVIWAKGTIRKRENPNPSIPTGLIEVLLTEFEVINKSELPPFEISDSITTNEELRLRYRYLDLRRHALQKNFLCRHKVYQIVHKYYDENGFYEVETPVLMKSTPEGARDFLVPSRINKGRFYALPQSPQIFKQILMMSGFERYMQIVKCFRDEDLRSDRQPEFTQVDVEMSFIDMEDIITITEGLFVRLWKEILDIEITVPFRRMSFADAMSRYGSDKPDLRFDMEIKTISDLVKNCGFKVFTDCIETGGTVALINAKKCAGYSRKNLDELTDYAKKYGARGLAWLKYVDGEINSPIAKFFSDGELKQLLETAEAENGDLLLFVSDATMKCFTALGALRLEIARREGILDKVKDDFNFLWVIDFPMFEYDATDDKLYAMHHAFTSPSDEDVHLLDSEPAKVRAKAYDIVVNGAEVGGGSIRIHDSVVQSKILSLMGISPEDAEVKFGFLLEALKYGTPPHGGIALGLDRVVMTLLKTDNIRDVIAFPKTTSGLSLMDGSPDVVDNKQLVELGIKLAEKE